VNDASFVHVSQGVGQSRTEVCSLSRRERPGTKGLGERLAGDKFHDQVGLVAYRANVKEPDQTGMFETLQSASFLAQPSCELRITRADNLDRDVDAGDLVSRLIHVRHSASAEQADEAVTAAQDISD
jgi:hypothetical protein